MSINDAGTVDVIGIEDLTGFVVLTIVDVLDWTDDQQHLLALQAKLNAYMNFIESGQIWESYPGSDGRPVVIDIVGRFAVPEAGRVFLERVSSLCAEKQIEIRSRFYPDEGESE